MPTSKEFLKAIGDRPLNDKEVYELHLLRLKEGKGGIIGLLGMISKSDSVTKLMDTFNQQCKQKKIEKD